MNYTVKRIAVVFILRKVSKQGVNKLIYEGLILDEERALYGVTGATVRGCTFAGDADGESALKETEGLRIVDCDFRLRYPMWHMRTSSLDSCVLTETCRAALWYCDGIHIKDTRLGGIKALRECRDVKLESCVAFSTEFGWFCGDISITGGEINGEYPFLKTSGLTMKNATLNGKYSFQYIENAEITGCTLNTKDAFWHAKNVTVTDSVVKGEYLGWYSENLTLIRCKIIGTQPLCYCKGLTLIDCEMLDADLSFERSEVKANVTGAIESVKNPISGEIIADSISEIILDIPTECVIKTR